MPEAADIDWVSFEELSPEQRAVMDEVCCGRYIEPVLPAVPGTPGTIVLDGDDISADETRVTLEGNLRIRQDGTQVSATRGTYDRNSGVIEAQEDIRIRQSGLLLTGTSARVERASGTSSLREGSFLLHEAALRGNADIIVYTDADGVITIDNGVFTRCEPGDNSWLVAGSSIRLDRQSGRGTARDVTLRVGEVPVFYLPWVSFPINDERASGFLAPVIGNTRDGGLDLATPYYLNLAPNYDATLTPRVQTERGLMLGGEFRHRGRASQQILELQYLPDDKLYDPATATLPLGDGPPVPERWLLDYELRAVLGPRWSASADYATVSDIDYFQDLGSGGLLNTTRSFLYRDAQLRYASDNWNLTAAAQGFQIIDPAVPPQSVPYRSLPRINLEGAWYRGTSIEYGVEGEYVNFDRSLNPARLTQAQIDAGQLVTGSRYAFAPRLSLPFTSAGAFVVPTLAYHYTGWQLDDQAAGTAASPTRGLFRGSLDGGLVFERELNLGGSPLVQTLEPRLFYLYNEYEDQSTLPVFDSGELTFSFNQLFRENRFSGNDRIGDANQLTLALSTRLLDRGGREKARASLGQIRYFEDRRVTLFSPPGVPERRAGSALAGEASWQLAPNWRAGSYLEWDTRERELQVGNFQIQYQSDINRILNFGYRYREYPASGAAFGADRTINQTDLSAIWPLAANWGLIGRWNYDHANERNLETIAGVEYRNCCWTVRVLAREWIDNDALYFGNVEDSNTGVFVQFELRGLGSVLGGNVAGILNNGIRGFRERDYLE